MGIIIRQSIKGSIWSYLGVGIGFITTAYLFPKYLSTDTIGLFGLLGSWSIILAQLFSLGINGVTARLFPFFRDKNKGHHGYLFIALLVIIVGFGLFLIFFFIFSPYLAENNAEKSRLFSEYIYLLIPLTFFTLLYFVFDEFNKLLYNAVFGTFLIEFLQRLFILIVVLAFIFNMIVFNKLVLLYTLAVCTKGIIMFIFLLVKGEVSFKPQLKYIDRKLGNEMVNVALYSILAGIGGNLVFNIDKIIVNQMLGLNATGIYSIAFFFGTLVVIPSRPLLRITGTLIADAWKRNDIKYISEIYNKSCLNQLIIATFLFGGIWINIDNILLLIGPDYNESKWVIFFIGIGYLIDMATGANGLIIAYSIYYRITLWFLLILALLVVGFMYLLIPVWGITGAAISITISFFINNLMRFFFLYRKYKMQPFNYKFILIIISFCLAFCISKLLPTLPLLQNILVKSSVYSVLFFILLIIFNVSEDIVIIKNILKKHIFFNH